MHAEVCRFGEMFPTQMELVLLARSQRYGVAWPCSPKAALDKSVHSRISHATHLQGSEMPVSSTGSYSSEASFHSACLEPLFWSLHKIWWLRLKSSAWQLKAAGVPGLLPFYEAFIYKVSNLALTQKAEAVMILPTAAINPSHYRSCSGCMT